VTIFINGASSQQPLNDNNNNSITIGAFYYSWYIHNFHGGHYLRGALLPPQSPTLGEYDQRNASVISQHLAWSRQANIRVWFTSWSGPNSTEDGVIRNSIVSNPDVLASSSDFKIAILYETTGRLGVNNSIGNFKSDMNYIAQNYFGRPNYYYINNRPVVFIYLTRLLQSKGILQGAIQALRAGAAQQGYDSLYIIGDHVFGTYGKGKIDNTTCTLMDALGTYDVYGSMGASGYAGRRAVSKFGRRQKGWRIAAHSQGCAFIPSISSGFNDRAVRNSSHLPLSRQLTHNLPTGSLFRDLLQRSLTLIEQSYSGTGNLLLVTSWNEWHEDTQIEPTVALTNVTSTNLPTNLTNGLNYDSYGTLFLDILSSVTMR
jgi:hypothetical protein